MEEMFGECKQSRPDGAESIAENNVASVNHIQIVPPKIDENNGADENDVMITKNDVGLDFERYKGRYKSANGETGAHYRLNVRGKGGR